MTFENERKLIIKHVPEYKIPKLEEKIIIVKNVINKYFLSDELLRFKQYKITIIKDVEEGSFLERAHGIYRTTLASESMKTPFTLPRKEFYVKCPKMIFSVLLDFIDKERYGAGVYWNFEGYALSLLIDAKTETIWDARGELTDQ